MDLFYEPVPGASTVACCCRRWRPTRDDADTYKLEVVRVPPRPTSLPIVRGWEQFNPPVAFQAQEEMPAYRWYATRLSWRRCLRAFLATVFLCLVSLHLGYYASYVVLTLWMFTQEYYGKRLRLAPTVVALAAYGAIELYALDYIPESRQWQFYALRHIFNASQHVYAIMKWYVLHKSSGLQWPGPHSMAAASIRKIIKFPQVPIGMGHSHPLCASTRNAADDTMDTHIRAHGYEPYSVQMSARDISQGLDGILSPLWPCDEHAKPRVNVLTSRHCLKFTNVDYYIDYLDFLWMQQPMMLYTFNPADPCGTYQEVQWGVDEENYVEVRIAGGGYYRHQLWDYDVDSITAHYPGIIIKYAVESSNMNAHWSLVLITPISATVGPWDIKPHHTLRRRQFIHDVTTMDGAKRRVAMTRHMGSRNVLSLSQPGRTRSVRMPDALCDVVTARVRLNAHMGVKLHIADLVGLLAGFYGDNKQPDTTVTEAQAMIFTCFPVDTVPRADRHTPWTDVDDAYSYRKIHFDRPGTLLPIEKHVGRNVAPPVIDTSFIPMKSKSNDIWTIEERITAVHNPQMRLPPKYEKYASEFLKLLLPSPGGLHPIAVSTVIDHQIRKAQRDGNLRASPGFSAWEERPQVVIRSFQKAEAYAEPKDPRNISTLPTEHCLKYSTYTYPLASLFKCQRWYAFGRTPEQIAREVHLIASKARHLIETDFKRFDGTHSSALYAFELMLLLRAFPTHMHADIISVHRLMTDSPARTAMGVKYSVGGSRLSGSADTSLMNSFDNAFIAYCVNREMGRSIADAYANLGIYGGDDGISPDVDKDVYERVVADLGLRLKAKCRPSDKPTSFLGRQFPNPRGHHGNMADLPRQLAKLHSHPSRDPSQHKWLLLYNRASGYLVTDGRTPILSHWSRMIMRLCPVQYQVQRAELKSYASNLHPSFLLWTSPLTDDEAWAHAADQLDLEVHDIVEYCRYLDALTNIDDLQPLKLRVGVVLPVGVVMGNELGVIPSTHADTKLPITIRPREYVAPGPTIALPPPAGWSAGPVVPCAVEAKRGPPVVEPASPPPGMEAERDPEPTVPDQLHELERVFPNLSHARLMMFRTTPIGVQSLSHARMTSAVYAKVLAACPDVEVAYDLTCGLGGDTIALAHHWPVIASDIDPQHLSHCAHNCDLLREELKLHPTMLIERSAAVGIRGIIADAKRSVVVMDPPWEGKHQQKERVSLLLDGEPVHARVQSLFSPKSQVRAVVVKLPPNARMDGFAMPGLSCTMYRNNKVAYVVICADARVVMPAMGPSEWRCDRIATSGAKWKYPPSQKGQHPSIPRDKGPSKRPKVTARGSPPL